MPRIPLSIGQRAELAKLGVRLNQESDAVKIGGQVLCGTLKFKGPSRTWFFEGSPVSPKKLRKIEDGLTKQLPA